MDFAFPSNVKALLIAALFEEPAVEFSLVCERTPIAVESKTIADNVTIFVMTSIFLSCDAERKAVYPPCRGRARLHPKA